MSEVSGVGGREACLRGAARFPAIALAPATFEAWLAARGPTTHAEDAFLACACAAGDRAALAELHAQLEGLRPLLARMDPSTAFADEVLQAAMVKLVVRAGGGEPGIAGYRATGPLRNWLRTWVVRLSTRLRQQRGHDDPLPSDSKLPALTPELDYLRAQDRVEVEACLREQLEALPDRERTMLRLHHAAGLPADRLGAMYHVSRPTMSRWLAKIREDLLAGVRDRLRVRLGLGDAELDSLLGVVASGLHVSVLRLLGAHD